MKKRIFTLLLMLTISGAAAFAQEKQKSHQHQNPAKTEKSPELSKPESTSGCHASCCAQSENKNEKSGQSEKTSKDVSTLSYTCPMHPEVTSDKPGRCPKCGMDLVKKK